MPSTKRSSGEAGKPAAKKARSKKTAAASAQLSVKQVRSGIGHAATFRRTLEALGLRHHQQTIVVNDNPSIRGMLFKVRHLVQVSPVQEG
jgi:large subunit ribosomal protein L30